MGQPHVRVEPRGVVPAEPMSREELRAANQEYFGALVAALGEEAARQVFERFLDWAEGSAAEAERVKRAKGEGEVKLAEVSLQG